MLEKANHKGFVLPDPPQQLTEVAPGVDQLAFMLTAKEMNAKCNETSEGGLAVSLVLC
jgi:hypothetical protein